MKKIHGIFLPETDTHFNDMISVGADAVHGKGTYQLKKYRAAMKYVKTRDTALDIGAHVGLWSRVMSYDFGSVLAFEPLQVHRDCFHLNLEGRTNVSMFPYALSDKGEKIGIHMPENNTGHAHVGKPTGVFDEEVQAVTLDSFRLPAEHRIGFLKVDVEGYELPVIRGAEKTIREHHPVIIVEQKPHGNAERYGWAQRDALKLLLSWGYRQVQEISGDHILVWP